MPDINPKILIWARETAGLAPAEAAQKLGIKASRLESFETGGEKPSRAALVKMAKHYRRPLVAFYLPEIPREGDHGRDFRTLPESVSRTDKGLADVVVRNIHARQTVVRASLEVIGEAKPLPFIGSMNRKNGVAAVVSSIEKTLGFNRKTFRDSRGPGESFAYLRGLVENCGVFVLLIDNLGSWHTTVSAEVFRGFALVDDVAPFVAVNANDSPSAWSFTLMHELAHLWIGASGVSGGRAEQSIEKFCNDVASEFLLPAKEVKAVSVTGETPLAEAMARIGEFARARKVSGAMVAYKLHRAGAYGFERFQEIAAAYRKDFQDRKEKEKRRKSDGDSGPNYYIVRKHRVGATLVRFVDRMMNEGYLSATKAGRVLGVGAHNVHRLIGRA